MSTGPDSVNLTPAQQAAEERLRAVAPAVPGLDRDALLYEAGQAAERARRRRLLLPWQSAAVVAAAVAIGLFIKPAPIMIAPNTGISLPRIVAAPKPAAPAPAASAYEASEPMPFRVLADNLPYLRERDAIIAHGFDALAPSPAPAGTQSSGAPLARPPVYTASPQSLANYLAGS